MLAWFLALAVGVVPPLIPEGPPIAPTDLVAGRQAVALRAPLVARTPGARLVLFVRDLSELGAAARSRNAGFEQAVPTGSVTAHLRGIDGASLVLEHTGYAYYRGFSGLVLTEREPGARNALYNDLEIDAGVALPDVRFVWLDKNARRLRDVPGVR